MKMTQEFQMLIRLVVDLFILEIRLPVRNDAPGDFCITVHMFSGQPKPTPLMLAWIFSRNSIAS